MMINLLNIKSCIFVSLIIFSLSVKTYAGAYDHRIIKNHSTYIIDTPTSGEGIINPENVINVKTGSNACFDDMKMYQEKEKKGSKKKKFIHRSPS
ncbi:TPA: hypothetical protein L0X66_000702 [Citrobacter freundii]|uniref:hypothetical protein n=1 Tax=Citrobacter freundii TaxID=546 RepID=UPI003839F294|nr:hypothetical protein [Citrobacter freundii]